MFQTGPVDRPYLSNLANWKENICKQGQLFTLLQIYSVSK